MRALVSAGLSVILMALPMSTPAQAKAQTATESHMPAARELAELVNTATTLEMQVNKMLAGMAGHAFTADPSMAALGEEYPGVDKVFVETLRPLIMDELTRIMPEYIETTAAFFARHYTPSEVGELLSFWRSPTGRALLQSVSGNLDYASISKEAVDQLQESDTVDVSGEAMASDRRRAAVAGLRELTPEQRKAVMRFGLTPIGRKMARLAPEKNELERQWANREPSAELMARIEEDVSQAVIAFIEAEDRKRAAAQ